MKKFTHKAIAAIMIAGASTGIASTAIMTTAYADTNTEGIGFGDSIDIHTDLYEDVTYPLEQEFEEGTTFKIGTKSKFSDHISIDENTGVITSYAGKPLGGVIPLDIIATLPNGEEKTIPVSIHGEAKFLSPNVKDYEEVNGKVQVKPGGEVSVDLSSQKVDDPSSGYRIVRSTIPENMKSAFRMKNSDDTLDFQAPEDFNKPVTLKVEVFTGVGEKNIKVEKTVEVTFTPEGSSNNKEDSTSESTPADGEKTNDEKSSDKNNDSGQQDAGKDSSNVNKTSNIEGENTTPSNDVQETSDKTGNEKSNDDDVADVLKEKNDNKDATDRDVREGKDSKSQKEDEEKDEENSSKEESQGSKVINNKSTSGNSQDNQNQQISPNPSQVNTPSFVPSAPQVNPVAGAESGSYGPKVDTGGEVDNIWNKIIGVFK